MKEMLQAELAKVNAAIQWIHNNPPTMDYMSEFIREGERLAKLEQRKQAIETLLNQTEEELTLH